MISHLFSLLDPKTIISTFGLIGVIAILFAESGTFLGFILPGDTLLITAGLLASKGYINLWLLLAFGSIAAILGDSVGYWFGRKLGPRLFVRDDSFLFKKRYLEQAKKFYDKHGKKTIIIGRFLAGIRMFAPILAGATQMNYGVFLTYNIIGGIFWVFSLSLLGFFLGETIPGIDRYILPIIIGVFVVSFIPPIFQIIKHRKK
ncbi:DedA family protein [Candidatus Nomurabacteria bacterium]|jgi:membrane-associated protein|nr:MAG: DedA family protein [Candidatus Nomurabacteria bacterium]